MEHTRVRANRVVTVVFAIVMVSSLGLRSSEARPHPDEMEDMKKALYDACSAKFPISDEVKAEAKKANFKDDRNLKCFIMCTLSELSVIDEEGNIDGDTLISLSNEKLKPIFEKTVASCLPNIAGKPDPCEVSFNLISCGAKLSPETMEMLPF